MWRMDRWGTQTRANVVRRTRLDRRSDNIVVARRENEGLVLIYRAARTASVLADGEPNAAGCSRLAYSNDS